MSEVSQIALTLKGRIPIFAMYGLFKTSRNAPMKGMEAKRMVNAVMSSSLGSFTLE